MSKGGTDVIFVHDFDATTAASCSSDRDADRLADCVETGTNKYVGPTDTGTSPDAADSDGDGLLDGDEVLGTTAGLDLRALGTSPLRRDVLLEYDWFDYGAECGPVSHRPSAGAIARVSAMFAASPVRNPDGSTGVNVIHDYGQGGAATGGNLVTGYSAVIAGALDTQYYEIKQKNFDPKRLGYFHYVLMAHRYNGGSNSSGYAEIVGDDMLVTLHCSKSDVNVGNTIAHELGHNLGLDHGGNEACNDKPNYNSIMNYRYQFAGVDAGLLARRPPAARRVGAERAAGRLRHAADRLEPRRHDAGRAHARPQRRPRRQLRWRAHEAQRLRRLGASHLRRRARQARPAQGRAAHDRVRRRAAPERRGLRAEG
jgi:hypothetical protein